VSTNIGYLGAMVTTSKCIYRGYRFPAEVIEQAVWLYFRFPLSLRMVEDLLAARGIVVSHEAVRCSPVDSHPTTCRISYKSGVNE
jgi:transposase-like protein